MEGTNSKTLIHISDWDSWQDEFFFLRKDSNSFARCEIDMLLLAGNRPCLQQWADHVVYCIITNRCWCYLLITYLFILVERDNARKLTLLNVTFCSNHRLPLEGAFVVKWCQSILMEISSSEEAQDIFNTMWHVASLFPEGNYQKIKEV